MLRGGNPVGGSRCLARALSAKTHAKTKEFGPVGRGEGGVKDQPLIRTSNTTYKH